MGIRGLSLVTLLASPIMSSSALAFDAQYDAHGMPTTVTLDSGDHLRLSWPSADHYTRIIMAERLPRSGRFTLESILPRAKRTGLPKRFTDALKQIEQGGNEWRPYGSADDYLAARPGVKFTLALNREVTERFGARFASEVFRRTLEAKPGYSAFFNRVVELGQNSVGQRPPQDVVVLFVAGTGVGAPDQKSAKKTTEGALFEDLRQLGYRVYGAPTRQFGHVDTNGIVVRDFLKKHLASNESVLVIAMSRGVAETATALRLLRGDAESSSRLDRQLVGFVNLSGLVRGSFIADWMHGSPFFHFLSPMLSSLKASLGLTHRAISALFARNESALRGIPVVVNLTGVTGGDGRVRDSDMRAVQDWLVRGLLRSYGSNDGLIEFPETLIPSGLATRTHDLVVDSSHVMLDGSFGPFDLRSNEGRRAWIQGVLLAAIEASRTISP